MRFSTLRNMIALLLSLGLGAAVLTQSDDAMADGSSDQHTQQKNDSSSTAETADTQASEKAASDFKEWTKSEKPDDDIANYASTGLNELDTALGSVTADVRSQPMGGGPTADNKAEGDSKQDKAQQKMMGAEALSDIKPAKQKLSQMAGEIREGTESAESSKQFHEAAYSASQIFSSLQQARFPDLEKDVEKVQKRADKIDASKPLASQEKEVKKFFEESSDVLGKMSDTLKKDAVGGGPSSDQEDHQKDDMSGQEQQNDQGNTDSN